MKFEFIYKVIPHTLMNVDTHPGWLGHTVLISGQKVRNTGMITPWSDRLRYRFPCQKRVRCGVGGSHSRLAPMYGLLIETVISANWK